MTEIRDREIIQFVRHGLLLSVMALIAGLSWAGYLATHHEQLHGGFEQQEAVLKARERRQQTSMHVALLREAPRAHAHGAHDGEPPDIIHRHSHSGSLAMDAMQRLMRGHIHWMGLGILSTVLLLIVACTSLKAVWKKTLGWTFGIGSLAYPVAWIVMGFRTVTMGSETAEASVMWLFIPAAGLVLASLIAVFGILLLEITGWHTRPSFSRFFEPTTASEE